MKTSLNRISNWRLDSHEQYKVFVSQLHKFHFSVPITNSYLFIGFQLPDWWFFLSDIHNILAKLTVSRVLYGRGSTPTKSHTASGTAAISLKSVRWLLLFLKLSDQFSKVLIRESRKSTAEIMKLHLTEPELFSSSFLCHAGFFAREIKHGFGIFEERWGYKLCDIPLAFTKGCLERAWVIAAFCSL